MRSLLHTGICTALVATALANASAQRAATSQEQRDVESAAVAHLISDSHRKIPHDAVFDPRLYAGGHMTPAADQQSPRSTVRPPEATTHTVELARALGFRLLDDAKLCQTSRPEACRLDGASLIAAFKPVLISGDTAVVTLAYWQPTAHAAIPGRLAEAGIQMTMLRVGNEWQFIRAISYAE